MKTLLTIMLLLTATAAHAQDTPHVGSFVEWFGLDPASPAPPDVKVYGFASQAECEAAMTAFLAKQADYPDRRYQAECLPGGNVDDNGEQP